MLLRRATEARPWYAGRPVCDQPHVVLEAVTRERLESQHVDAVREGASVSINRSRGTLARLGAVGVLPATDAEGRRS